MPFVVHLPAKSARPDHCRANHESPLRINLFSSNQLILFPVPNSSIMNKMSKNEKKSGDITVKWGKMVSDLCFNKVKNSL